ncbi:MAG: efflux RND transporter periplasmic adaptor subunit [Planctomycetota bacterium]|nr:efflux RND transporter periplasmic adaptor subunit [Planctomycetota bacterium]
MVNTPVTTSTMDLSATRMRVRSEIVFIPQFYQGALHYHLEDASTSSYYRIGYPEYVFVSLLDGNTTFAEALTSTAQQLGPAALQQGQALQVYAWLAENNLASFTTHPTKQASIPNEKRNASFWNRFNPFWVKFPLLQPDRILSALLPTLGWIFSMPSVAASILLAGTATTLIMSQWDRFVATSQTVFSTANWGWMIASWILLKCIHEFGHGLACRRYGGNVKEMGLVFILLAPLAYVDVTSAWKFPTKWQRIQVALAGVYLEFITASLAAIVWSHTESTLVAHLLYNLIIMASATTILFNLNPLMRFDGYYVFSDLLEIPNLYSEGAQFVQRLSSRVFYGTHCATPQRLGATHRLIGVYGLASGMWRVAACASLALAASILFHGAGIVLAAAGLASWFAAPIVRVLRGWPDRFREAPHTVYRAILVSSCLVGFLTAAFCWLPNPWPITAPGMIDYHDLTVVRSATNGFVKTLHVHDGQDVSEGELLITLHNEQVTNDYNELLHELEQIRIRQRMAVDKRDAAQEQIEARNHLATEQRLVASRRQYEGLSIRAPIAGRVMGRNIQQRVETYVEQGAELLCVGNDNHKELVLSVADANIDDVLPIIGSTVKVRIGSRGAMHGTLTRVEPRASTQLEHLALAATAGGPLTVREADTPDPGDASSVELTEPRYRAVVTFPTQCSRDLLCGERGYAALGTSHEPIGVAIRTWMSQWIDSGLQAANNP